jgi:hypothetical protein
MNTSHVPSERVVHGDGIPSEDEIDAQLEESFPASDPPSWTLGVESTSEPHDGENRLLPPGDGAE